MLGDQKGWQHFSCPIPTGHAEVLLTTKACRHGPTAAQVLWVSLRAKVEPAASHLLLSASELPTHSPMSRSARLCSCFHCSIQRRSNRLPSASRDRNVLAVMDVKGFDPEEVTVKVKDRKVQVLAEHEEAHTSPRGREYNYKNVRKEISLPPGVSEDEVTYSVGSNRIMKIETAHKHCPCLMRF